MALVDPAQLRALLETARECGASKLKVTASGFEVEFEARPEPLGLVDEKGKPVNLDKGMPDTAGGDEDDDLDPIQRANFPQPAS